jgi:hypothetical protein
MNYVTYTPSTGEIKTWGESEFPIPIDPSDLVLTGVGTYATHFISNGQIVAYTTSQAAIKAAIPAYAATWSNSSFTWVDTRSLSDAKDQTWSAMKVARDANLAAGFTWNGSKFDSDDVSQQRIQGAVQLASLAAAVGQPFSITWTLFDNTTRTMSGSEMIAVGIALGTFVQNVFTAGVALRNQIDAATSLSTLQGITWAAIS